MPLLMRNGIRRHPHAYLHLFQRLLVSKNDLGSDFRRGAVEAIAHRLHVLEVPGDEIHKALVIQISSSSNNHVSRGKALAVEVHNRRTLESPDSVASSKNRPPQRMILPEILGENFMDQVVGIVLVHLDFFQNYSAFASYVLDIENWIQHQIAEHVESNGQVFVENLDAKTDTLFCGERVDVAADRINLPCDFFRRAVLSAFEDHVLDEMRYAVPLQVFVARTSLYPNAYRDGPNVFHLLGDDAQPVRQHLTPNISVFIHRLIVTYLRDSRET